MRYRLSGLSTYGLNGLGREMSTPPTLRRGTARSTFLRSPSDTCYHAGENTENFIVGLTNSHPLVDDPQPGSYAVCGQYQGTVAQGATVKLPCNETEDLPQARYVIVLFPTTERLHFCELEVYTPEGGNDCIGHRGRVPTGFGSPSKSRLLPSMHHVDACAPAKLVVCVCLCC